MPESSLLAANKIGWQYVDIPFGGYWEVDTPRGTANIGNDTGLEVSIDGKNVDVLIAKC